MCIERVRVMPEAVGPANLAIRESPAGLPGLDSCEPAQGQRWSFSLYSISAPAPIAIGPGVATSNPSHGGVIASRLKASAKNSKVSAGASGTSCCLWRLYTCT